MFDLIGGTIPEDVKPSPVGASNQFISNFELDIKSYIDWRNRDISSVPADHWMVNLLTILSSRVGYDLSRSVEDIYRRCHYLSDEMARQFGFTTTANAGRLHIGDNGNKTVYLIGESPWRQGVTRSTPYTDMVAIRYLSHDSTNLTMGCNAEDEGGLGIGINLIELDLGLLMLQFTLWMKEQLESAEESVRNTQMFVAMHVLPKLKVTQYALAMMNRCRNIVHAHPSPDDKYRLSKNFADRTLAGQTICKSFCEIQLKKNSATFEYLIGSLAVPMVGSLGRALRVTDYAPTQQITWALILARYAMVRYCYALAHVDFTNARMYPVNDIRRVIVRMMNNNGCRQVLSGKFADEVEDKLEGLWTVVHDA